MARLPRAARVVTDTREPHAIRVEIANGGVNVDPDQVFGDAPTITGASRLTRGGGLQRVTPAELSALLGTARDVFALHAGQIATEGSDRVSTRSLLVVVDANAAWQVVAWVVVVSLEQRFRRVEFEAMDNTGKTGRAPLHMPPEFDGQPRVMVRLVQHTDRWGFVFDGQPEQGIGDVRIAYPSAIAKATPIEVEIAGDTPVQVALDALLSLRDAGFERMWWAMGDSDVPSSAVRESLDIPPQRGG